MLYIKTINIKIDNLGGFLKEERKKNKLSLRDLSKNIDLSIGYISRIENNIVTPSFDILTSYSNLFGFNLEDIISESSFNNLKKEEVLDLEDIILKNKISFRGNTLNYEKKKNILMILNAIIK